MKHLKKFNESKSDGEFHKEQIKDLLMDVVDEFGIDHHMSGATGIFYDIHRSLSYASNNRERIRLWIASCAPGTTATLSDDIKNSKALVDFENRLRAIGYVIEKTRTSYYEIIISYDNI